MLVWKNANGAPQIFSKLRWTVSRFPISASAVGARTKLISTVGLFILAIFGAYLVSQFLVANDWTGLALIAMAFFGLAFAIRILNNWRDGLYIFFGWLFFEDFARKYLGNNMAIYFGKDVLVLLVYISFFRARRNRKEKATFKPPFLVPLLILLWFAVAQVFNPASTSVFYGFLVLKLYFLYNPLP